MNTCEKSYDPIQIQSKFVDIREMQYFTNKSRNLIPDKFNFFKCSKLNRLTSYHNLKTNFWSIINKLNIFYYPIFILKQKFCIYKAFVMDISKITESCESNISQPSRLVDFFNTSKTYGYLRDVFITSITCKRRLKRLKNVSEASNSGKNGK